MHGARHSQPQSYVLQCFDNEAMKVGMSSISLGSNSCGLKQFEEAAKTASDNAMMTQTHTCTSHALPIQTSRLLSTRGQCIAQRLLTCCSGALCASRSALLSTASPRPAIKGVSASAVSYSIMHHNVIDCAYSRSCDTLDKVLF